MDYELVTEFLKGGDYKTVAEKLKKKPSLIWKRKRSLKIREYKAIKTLIRRLAEKR